MSRNIEEEQQLVMSIKLKELSSRYRSLKLQSFKPTDTLLLSILGIGMAYTKYLKPNEWRAFLFDELYEVALDLEGVDKRRWIMTIRTYQGRMRERAMQTSTPIRS